MKSWALASYFVVPALVYTANGIQNHGGHSSTASELLQFFIPNYLFFAAPLAAWAVLSKALKLSTSVSHAGYMGATLALISLFTLFECCVDNSNAMGWLYYWPFAIVLAVSCAIYKQHSTRHPK
jgi:hypothetical protein